MKIVLEAIDRFELEPRTLGRSDYPTELPLREVYIISKHCAGVIVLGFEQFATSSGTWKRGTNKEYAVDVGSTVKFPTPWNHLESGILYSLGLPILVLKKMKYREGCSIVELQMCLYTRCPPIIWALMKKELCLVYF